MTDETLPQADATTADDDTTADTWTCDVCGTEFDRDTADPIDRDGTPLCEDCDAEQWTSCRDCGTDMHVDDVPHHCDDEPLCDRCYSRHYFTCDDCGEVARDADGSIHIEGTGTVCVVCYENGDYFCCEDCGDYFHSDDYAGDGLCVGCEREHGLIRDYSCKEANDLDKLGDAPDGLYLGVELEVEVTGYSHVVDRAELTLDKLGTDFVVLKHDGSLNNGFEIVTCPATLDVHRERWDDFLSDRPKGLKSWDTSTCGMHVHASRRAISPLTLGKILVFVNADANADFVSAVAGRGPVNWCKRYAKTITDAKRPGHDRYEAVNLTNSATIEFRIFRGTLNRQSFLKNIEFVDALIRFCRWAGMGQLDAHTFIKWVESAPNAYPHLLGWLRDNHMARRPKPKPESAALVMATADATGEL